MRIQLQNKKKKKKTHKILQILFYTVDEMLPVSHINISIVHLFFFTLIPKHTPKGKKQSKFPKEQISFV